MYMPERPGGPGQKVSTMRRFLIFVASFAFLPAMAYAQGRGGGRGMSGGMSRPAMASSGFARSAMAAPHVAMRAFQPAGTRSVAGFRAYPGVRYVRTRSGAIVARPVVRQTMAAGTARSSRRILSEDVPGLGFDYAHAAAVHPQGTFGRARGHGRGRFNQFAGAYFPFYGGGYYLPLFPDDDIDYDQSAAVADAQQVDTGEPEPVQEQDAQPSTDVVPNYSSAAPARAQDSDQYVFVRRDGTLFFATAFAWENGALRYITREGLRRPVSLDQLDLHATQQFNEQRGLNFRLPV
ncbi:MAG: hypothetical protein WA853_17630 [Candidatus Acidiferrum sp.]